MQFLKFLSKQISQKIQAATELPQLCIQENTYSAQIQEEYTERYNDYVTRYDTAKLRFDTLQKKKSQWLTQADTINRFMFELSERTETITEFEEKL